MKKSHAYISYEESVSRAKQAQQREREEVYRATGLRIMDDGRVQMQKESAS